MENSISISVCQLSFNKIGILLQEEDINEIHDAVNSEKPNVDRQVRSMLEELASSCHRYTSAKISGSSAGKTLLDQERTKMCQSEIVRRYRYALNCI